MSEYQDISAILKEIWFESSDPEPAYREWLDQNAVWARQPVEVEKAIERAPFGTVASASFFQWLLEWRSERALEESLRGLAAQPAGEAAAVGPDIHQRGGLVSDPAGAFAAGVEVQYHRSLQQLDSRVARSTLSARIADFESFISDDSRAPTFLLASQAAQDFRIPSGLIHRTLQARSQIGKISAFYSGLRGSTDDHLCFTPVQEDWRRLFSRPYPCCICNEYFRVKPADGIVFYGIGPETKPFLDSQSFRLRGKFPIETAGVIPLEDSIAALLRDGIIEDTEPLKIAHISDLHFVNQGGFRWAARSLRIGVADTDRFESLSDLLAAHHSDIDVLVVSGDLTTLGDRSSLVTAQHEITHLASRVGLGPERIIVVPGNHDRILDFLSPFGQRSGFEATFGEWREPKTFSIRGKTVHFVPIDSTIRDFRRIGRLNQGEVDQGEFNRLKRSLEGLSKGPGDISVAVLHHHPLPLPATRLDGFTAMTNGGTVMNRLHELGVNIVLHGHKHRHYSCQVRYSMARPLVLVASGSGCEGSDVNSFSIIKAQSSGTTSVDFYVHAEEAFRRETDSCRVFS